MKSLALILASQGILFAASAYANPNLDGGRRCP
jgi:hypothetical protein